MSIHQIISILNNIPQKVDPPPVCKFDKPIEEDIYISPPSLKMKPNATGGERTTQEVATTDGDVSLRTLEMFEISLELLKFRVSGSSRT